MSEVTLVVRPVTAIFSHGAGGGQSAAEWRPPALRGLARYWLRALCPLAGLATPSQIRRLESMVFGAADEGVGQGVWLHSRELEPCRAGRRFLLPHHPKNGGGAEGPCPSQALVEGRWELRVRGTCARPAAAALWVGLALGGLGQRSRRGAGSLEVVDVKGLDLPRTAEAGTIQELERLLARGLRMAVQEVGRLANGGGQPRPAPDFPSLAGARLLVAPLRPAKTEEEARAAVMRGLKEFKSPAFGLPYIKPKPGDNRIAGKDVRWASPVHIHIARLRDASFVGVHTWMRSSPPEVCRSTRNLWQRVEDYLNKLSGALPVQVDR